MIQPLLHRLWGNHWLKFFGPKDSKSLLFRSPSPVIQASSKHQIPIFQSQQVEQPTGTTPIPDLSLHSTEPRRTATCCSSHRRARCSCSSRCRASPAHGYIICICYIYIYILYYIYVYIAIYMCIYIYIHTHISTYVYIYIYRNLKLYNI